MLVLDGVIQITERDEFSYQEMMGHVPLFSHPNPEKICIIGGGDGGVLTEVCKHPSVKEIILCEIDVEVINASKKFFPKFRRGFEDPRVTVHYGDGAQFLKSHENSFDVVVTDSSDPIGPASSLFESEYYVTLKKSLRSGGITASQGECIWIHLEMIKQLSDCCKKIFNTVEYAYVAIPTYPSGQIGILLCTDNQTTKVPLLTPEQKFTAEDALSLKYYSPDIHRASFVLPPFAKLLQ